MKHILYFILIQCTAMICATEYYAAPLAKGTRTGLSAENAAKVQVAASKAKPGDIVYLLPGTYQATSGFILEYFYDGGDETLGYITFKSLDPNDRAIFKTYTNTGTSPSVGNWALIKVYPRWIDNKLNIPKYLIFEDIVFEGNSMDIFTKESGQTSPAYEEQPGAYCNQVTPEGYIIKNSCPPFATCTDTDGDGVFNDNSGCEYVRYNGQGLLVTGPFNWDGAIKDLINRRKPDGTVIQGTNNYAIPHHINVRNCTFKHFPGAGLSFQRCDYITVENCVVANNCWYTIFGSSGINFYQMVPYEGPGVNYATDTDYRIKVVNNVCYGNSLRVENQNLVVRYDGNGIIIDDFTHEQDYRTLSQINAHRAGFGLSALTENPTNPNRGYFYYGAYKGKTLVANNIVYGNGGSGLKVYSSQYVDVINNTFYNNGIGNYRNTRIGLDQPPLGWLRPQQSLFVQAIVDEKASEPKPTIMPGYNRVYNNITYNTLGYPNDNMPAEWLAYGVANAPADLNTVGNNFLANPGFITVPTLDLLNNKAVSGEVDFRFAATSPAVNYGVYRSEAPQDILGYLRDIPDAGAYEISMTCVDKAMLGSTVTTVPAGQPSTVSPGVRKVYHAQSSITFSGVYSTQAGAVLNTQIIACNKQVATARTESVQASNQPKKMDNDLSIQHNLAYPNPVKGGTLYFTSHAYAYEIRTIEGIRVGAGSNVDQVSVEELRPGLYFLNIEGQVQKILIE